MNELTQKDYHCLEELVRADARTIDAFLEKTGSQLPESEKRRLVEDADYKHKLAAKLRGANL